MAIKVETAQRKFSYNGVSLADPGTTFSPEQVKEFYAAVYPEIINATVEGPEQQGNKLLYTFRRSVGSKG